MLHVINNYDEVFSVDEFEQIDEKMLLDSDIKKYRVKTIKSGPMIEYECYPVWNTSKSKRLPKTNPSKKAQHALNNKNIIKHVIRIINNNFKKGDTWATFTFDNKHLPITYEEAKKIVTNYIRRLKRALKKSGQDNLKYIYVIEFDNLPSKKKVRMNVHMVLNTSDRDLVENKWTAGARTHTRRMQPDESGFEGMARYIMKDPKGKKKYTPSRNLKKPRVTVSDSKMTKKKANNIAINQNMAKEVFEKFNPKYRFVAADVRISEFVSGAYIYAKLRLKE